MRWISSVNFLHTTKSRLPDPSEICALEFKGEFLQFRKLVGFKRLSASVGRFSNSPSRTVSFGPAKKTVIRMATYRLARLGQRTLAQMCGSDRPVMWVTRTVLDHCPVLQPNGDLGGHFLGI